MTFFDQINLKPQFIMKIAGLVVLVVLVLVFIIRLLGSSFFAVPTMWQSRVDGSGTVSVYPSNPMMGAPVAKESAPFAPPMPSLSVQNLGVQDNVVPGSDAELFEATRYTAQIETRTLRRTCDAITELKPLEYVVFESVNESDHFCAYTFKVEKEHLDDVLARIKSLHPRELNEGVVTIKRELDDFTSEREILEKKRAALEKTMEDAIRSYDGIADVATRAQDVSSLAKVIDSKLQMIERLTNERISINAQLERLDRARSESLDQVEYAMFQVNIYETRFVDGEQLKDSWKAAIQAYVLDLNRIIQDVTIGLAVGIFFVAQYILYGFLLLIVGKYVWKAATYLWKK